MSRKIGQITEIVKSDLRAFERFHDAVAAGHRLPEENIFDPIRQAGEALFFPYYFSDIHFAALSLDGMGAGYGECHLTLKESAISRRASVFLENCLLHVSNRKTALSKPLEKGFRATWKRRADLALVKAAPSICKNKPSKGDFPRLLLSDFSSTTTDCIEVHIYGSLQRRSVESAILCRQKLKADQVLLNSVRVGLESVGCSVVVK